ncbi:hypothetical protein ACHAPO_011733 [Fusarium lateritium]
MHTSWGSKEFPFYQFLHQWRFNTLGQKDDILAGCYWNKPDDYLPEESGVIRVLTCGNCGVGKSSLINKVFGIKATSVAHRTRGIHQIDDEIKWKDRPDLVVHDSGGFEAGGQDELSCVQNFLKKRSGETDFKERLHVIWYCFEVKDARLEQAAQTKLFKSLSEYAQDVPLVAIATKKDEFLGAMLMEARRVLPQRQGPVTLEALYLYGEKELQARLCRIDEELNNFGRFHDLVAISMPLGETIKIYRRILVSSSAAGAFPGSMTTNRTVAAIDVCRVIIMTFGISTITADTIFSICKANIWDDFGNNIRTTIAEISALCGLGFTVLSGGMPFFVIPMATNVPLVVLATTRLVLMFVCDVILILT